MNKIELTEEQIEIGLNDAYKKAGHNAYFANGFKAGINFIIEHYKQDQAEQLNMHDVSKRLLNISNIMEISEQAERSFFNWLTYNSIWWGQTGTDLIYITVYEKDIQAIKNTWNEVSVC